MLDAELYHSSRDACRRTIVSRCCQGKAQGPGGVQTAKASRKQSSLSGKESAQGCAGFRGTRRTPLPLPPPPAQSSYWAPEQGTLSQASGFLLVFVLLSSLWSVGQCKCDWG